nr:MAG TPA: hypothetical protein [Bacteriophage sp.]DAR18247.1 MAG TPA: hypothetical protein [Bacteriophage sp.]
MVMNQQWTSPSQRFLSCICPESNELGSVGSFLFGSQHNYEILSTSVWLRSN